MLVLSRKLGQRILIGDNIYVTVLDVQGERVRLGFDAPRNVSIVRKEIAHCDQTTHKLLDGKAHDFDCLYS